MFHLTTPSDSFTEPRRHARRIRWLALLAIVVSFAHMVATLALFGTDTLTTHVVAAGMTLLIDVTIWVLAEYRQYAQRRDRRPSVWIGRLFGLTLLIAMLLNGGYMWVHRPVSLPASYSAGLAVVFALLIPGIVAVTGIIQGELAQDEAQLHREAAATAQLDAECAVLREQLYASQEQLAQQERAHAATHRQLTESAAQDRVITRTLEHTIAQLRAEMRDQEQSAAHHAREGEMAMARLRAALEQATEQLAQVTTDSPLDPRMLARQFAQLSVPTRTIARAFGRNESTVRGWVSAAEAS